VLSPVYDYMDVIDSEIGGPKYPERDFVYVYCKTRVRAKSLALRHFRKLFKNSLDRDYLWGGENPFNGMSVTPMGSSFTGPNSYASGQI
jgi:hypothetical protein